MAVRGDNEHIRKIPAVTPRDSGPLRLHQPVSAPVLPAGQGDEQPASARIRCIRYEREADAFNALALISLHAKRYSEAAHHASRALRLARESGFRGYEPLALIHLATALRQLRQYSQAVTHAQHGLALARATRQRLDEAAALASLAGTYAELGEPSLADEHARKAALIYQAAEIAPQCKALPTTPGN